MFMRSLRTVFSGVAGSAFLLAGCVSNETGTGPAPLGITGHNVDPDMAQACVVASANKYYLPANVIQAVSSRKMANSSTQLVMRVDLRSAVCTISPDGAVRSVVDTTPKSADQVLAEKNAAMQHKPG